jgi:hypothetical protein
VVTTNGHFATLDYETKQLAKTNPGKNFADPHSITCLLFCEKMYSLRRFQNSSSFPTTRSDPWIC